MMQRESYPAGVPCWVDTMQPDPDAATAFYGALFGWEFENRAPEGYHLFTTFIGGSQRAELCDLPENELRQIAEEELKEILGIDGEPVFSSVKKWQRAIPQYNIGYEKVVNTVEAFKTANRGVFFCSNFYKGISVGDCVKNGVATAREVVDFLNW